MTPKALYEISENRIVIVAVGRDVPFHALVCPARYEFM